MIVDSTIEPPKVSPPFHLPVGQVQALDRKKFIDFVSQLFSGRNPHARVDPQMKTCQIVYASLRVGGDFLQDARLEDIDDAKFSALLNSVVSQCESYFPDPARIGFNPSYRSLSAEERLHYAATFFFLIAERSNFSSGNVPQPTQSHKARSGDEYTVQHLWLQRTWKTVYPNGSLPWENKFQALCPSFKYLLENPHMTFEDLCEDIHRLGKEKTLWGCDWDHYKDEQRALKHDLENCLIVAALLAGFARIQDHHLSRSESSGEHDPKRVDEVERRFLSRETTPWSRALRAPRNLFRKHPF